MKKMSLISLCFSACLLCLISISVSFAYTDVNSYTDYNEAINYITDNNIVEGYADGTYRPYQTMKRSELLKIVIESKYTNEFDAYVNENCFNDVTPNEWFNKYACFGKALGIVEGYSDGSFRGGNEVKFVEALKMAMVTFGYNYIEGSPWYYNIVNRASEENFIPLDVVSFDQQFNRGQMADLVTRMLKEETGELNDYLGEKASYYVTYETIQNNRDIASIVGTGMCELDGYLYSNGYELGNNPCQICVDTQWQECVIIIEEPAQPDPEPIQEEAWLSCDSYEDFNMIVIFDDSSYNATENEIIDYFDYTSELLRNRTCININVLDILRVDIENESTIEAQTFEILGQNEDLVREANGLTLFSEKNECASTHGGCAWSISPSYAISMLDYCNTYQGINGMTNMLYSSIIDWNHMYARCGYDDNENRISDVSIGGECRNQEGTACVLNNGYYMCENLLDSYYATDPRLMTASSIVHEMMHHFGEQGIMDHNFTTSICVNNYEGTFENIVCPASSNESDCFFSMCYYTWENFMNAENVCQ